MHTKSKVTGEQRTVAMPRSLNGWIYLKPRDAAPRSKWEIPRSVMRQKVKTLIGLPVILEHDMAHDPDSFEGDQPVARTAMKIGTIRDAMCLEDGSTRIAFDIDDGDDLGKEVLKKIDVGVLNGLSLSHRRKGGEYTFLEVSVTCAPKREGTYIVRPKDVNPVFVAEAATSASALKTATATATATVDTASNAEAAVAASALKTRTTAAAAAEAEMDDEADSECEVVVCSRFAARFEPNEYMPCEAQSPVSTENSPVMSEAPKDMSMADPVAATPAPAPAATPVAAAPAPVEETDKTVEAIRQVVRKDLTEKDMAQLETLFDAVNSARLAKKELEEKDEQTKKEIERLEQKHKDDLKKQEDKHFMEARRHWSTMLAARAQNPDLAEQSNQGYAIMMQCETSQEINQKMEHFMNTYQKVTNNLVTQVTKGDTGSRDLIMEAFNNSNSKKRTMSSMSTPSPAPAAAQMMTAIEREPLPVAANSLSDQFATFRRKTQATNKTPPTKFEELVFNAAISVLEKDPENMKITLTEANNLVHQNVRALLSGRAHAFRAIDEMNPLLALEVAVVAAKAYPLAKTTELVSCSAIGRNMFGDSEGDEIQPSEVSVLQTRVANDMRGMHVAAVPFFGTEVTNARDLYR